MRIKKIILSTVKFVISLLLLYYIASKIDWTQALENLKKANYFFIFLTFLLIFLERVQLTYKWNLLVWARGMDISFWKLFLINSIGAFWGLFLPSSLGTDVAKSYYLIKNNSQKSISISSVFVDRIMGLLALLILNVFSLFFAGDLISKFNIKFYGLTFFIIFIILLYIFQREKTASVLDNIFSKFRFKSISEKVIKLHKSILEYKNHPKTLIITFILTLFVHITRVLIFYVISLAYGIPIPIVYFFIFVPILTVVIMIPISIGGLGVGEGVFIAFFSLIGISINDSIVVALTNTLSNTIFTLIGGLSVFFLNSPEVKEMPQVNKNTI